MNSTEAKTAADLRSLLNQAIDQSRRAFNAKVSNDPERRDEAFPLLDPAALAAMPPRARGPVSAAARRLAALAEDGNNSPALAALPGEAAALVATLPVGWTLPKMAPADVESLVDQITQR
jgi:hypothetical protein